MTKHLRFLFVMLLAMIWSAGWAQTTIWSEDWSGVKKQQTPSAYNSAIYSQSNNNTQIYVSNKAYAGGELPELLLKEGANSTWTVKINDLKGCKGDVTLTLKTNKIGNLNVSVGSSTIKLATVEGQKNTYSGSFNVDGLAVPFNIVFLNTDKNLRLDDIVLTGTPTGETKTATTLSFNTVETEFSVEKNSEASFTAPTATVKDADGKVVEGAKITYASSNSNIASVDENGKVTFGSEIGTATITASYAGDATYKPAASSYTIKYSKIPTFMAWSESVVNVNLGETFTAPTLTFTAHGVNLEGKTIQYSSSDETVATIDQTNGEITLKDKAGSTTITATFVGDDTHDKVSAEYTLNVIDPNKTTFDFTDPSNFGYSSTGKIQLKEGDKLIKDGFVLVNVQEGQYTTRFDNKSLKIYSGTKTDPNNGIISLSAPTGLAIKEIVFTDNNSNSVDNFTFSTGELKSKTWTGLAKTLTMEVAKDQVFIKTMTVYTVKIVELDENSESNTIEAKNGVNVTLKRTMVKGEWNTICLPFALTEDKAKAAFGDNVKIVELDTEAAVDANVLSFKASTGIAAATPYLIKPSTVADEYTFENVDITNNEAGYSMTNNSDIAFKGIYNTVDITKDVVDNVNASCYAAFLGAGNKIYKAGTGMTKGFRAYFAIPKSASASALRVVIDGTATSIKNIDSEVVESNAPVYNLQGQRVDGNNLTPGIYVKAGKKFVVK